MDDQWPASGAAVVDRSGEGRLAFTGDQAAWFVDQLFTNSFEDLAPMGIRESLLLTPKGKITAHLTFVRSENGLRAVVEGRPADAVAAFLEERIFATRVEVEDVTESTALLMIFGTAAAGHLLEAHPGIRLPEEEEATVTDGRMIARVPRPVEGFLIWLPADDRDEEVRRLVRSGVAETAPEVLESARIVAGSPRYGVDFTEAHLPQQAAMERAVRFDKGCYLGQEAVAMAQRGRVRRRLRHLRFEGEASRGEVVAGEASVGEVTSAVTLNGGGWGIGMIDVSVEDASTVEVEGHAAEVLELPGAVEGPGAPSARELRERLLEPGG